MLNVLSFGNNTFEGQIPTELAQCMDLRDIDFGFNNLTGDIDSVIKMLPRHVAELGLSNNRLSGTIPTSIGMLTNLNVLNLAENHLNGTIPTEIGLLTEVQVLGLFSNQLTGTVPSSLASLPLSKSHIQSHS
jgi:Leucine-rich repeat (LRR) protein